jgi:GNAT superfamily N-acetyltransferase
VSEPFLLRLGVNDDVPYVMDSWLQQERRAERRGLVAIEGHRFLPWQKTMQRQILGRSTVHLVVACLPDDPTVILGWAVTGPRCVYYVYVRESSRRLGLAKAMLAPTLKETGILYGARPAPEYDEASRSWRAHPVVSHIPKTWAYSYRVNFFDP